MQNPEIAGVEYSQGTLFGFHVREYLLEKWQRQCAYCHSGNVRLEIDHILPKRLGGTDCVDNLTIVCRSCNEKKGANTLQVFLKDQPEKVEKILDSSKKSFKDAAAVNASRYAIGQALISLGKPVFFWSGAQTKYEGVHARYCRILQRSDGYMYATVKQEERCFLPRLKSQVSAASIL
jgi:hypothetical protein